MTRLEEYEEITCKAVARLLEEKKGSFEERQAKIANACLCDIAKSLAVIADALSKEVSNESD